MTKYEIRCVDILEGLATLADESVDLTITSPPYNIGKEYESFLSLNEYLSWCEAWLKDGPCLFPTYYGTKPRFI